MASFDKTSRYLEDSFEEEDQDAEENIKIYTFDAVDIDTQRMTNHEYMFKLSG